MKAKIAPTSPRYKVKELENLYSSQENLKKIEKPPKKFRGELIFILFISLFLGFIGGFFGKIAIDYLATNHPEYTFNLFNTNSWEPDTTVIMEEKQSAAVYGDIIQNLKPSQVNIFQKKEGDEQTLAKAYLPQDKKGSGIIVSTDGLILTTKAVVEDFSQSYVIVTADKKIYEATDLNLDPTTDLVFLKINSGNLKVAQFSDLQEKYLGENGLVYQYDSSTDEEKLVVTEISNLKYESIAGTANLIHSTERFSRYLTVTGQLEDEFEGCPLIDLDGKIIGLSVAKRFEQNNIFIPIKYIEKILNSVLSEKSVVRTYLGLRYLNLAGVLNLPEELTGQYKMGFMIYGDSASRLSAIEKSSPADKSDLSEEDIIIKIDDQEVDRDDDLTDIIQSKQIGETIRFTIIRDGLEKTASIKLEKI